MLHDGAMRAGNGIDASKPSCVLTPTKDEGPYFVDERLLRSDIRTDPSDGMPEEGVPLMLGIKAVRTDGPCDPVEGVHVDIWHCNAQGVYSDVAGQQTVGRKFLRGCQKSSASGETRFTTIFPGWYSGRSVHIHLKVRLLHDDKERYEFTSQLFFEQDVVEEILTTHAPYSDRGKPDVTNDEDDIYGVDGGKLIVPITSKGASGLAGSIVIGLSGLPS
jgi:protocatechuate 3,4-dioxygenase beta subunit